MRSSWFCRCKHVLVLKVAAFLCDLHIISLIKAIIYFLIPPILVYPSVDVVEKQILSLEQPLENVFIVLGGSR